MPMETPHGISGRTPPRCRQRGPPSRFASKSQQAVSTEAFAMRLPRGRRMRPPIAAAPSTSCPRPPRQARGAVGVEDPDEEEAALDGGAKPPLKEGHEPQAYLAQLDGADVH